MQEFDETILKVEDSSTQTFTYGEHTIRGILKDGEPWIVGKDAALVLGYTNPLKALRDHVDAEDKGMNELFTPGGRQKAMFINESGVYSLVLSSKLPNARQFKRWVTSEVLPSIRKHGVYMTMQAATEFFQNPETIVRIVNNWNAEYCKRVELEKINAKQTLLLEAAKPKIAFSDAVSEAENTISVEHFAKILYGKSGIDMGRNRMFRWLRAHGFLKNDNTPYQKYLNDGWFQTHEATRNGKVFSVTTITGKGQQQLVKALLA